MKLIEAVGGAQDERTKYQDGKKFPVAMHDAMVIGEASARDAVFDRVVTIAGVMCVAAADEHDAIKAEEARRFLAANPMATAAPVPDKEDQSTGTVVGINPKGKIVVAGIGDSPCEVIAVNVKTGAVTYVRGLKQLQNENPFSYGDLNGHYLGAEHGALLAKDTTGKYVAQYDAHDLLQEDEILILNPRSDAMYGAIGKGAKNGKASDWSDSRINVEAMPEPVRPRYQQRKDAALAKLPEAQKFIADMQDQIGHEYAAVLERHIKESKSLSAQGIAEALVRATVEINKKYDVPPDEWDNDTGIAIIYDPKNPPEKTIYAVVADGNGKEGYRVANAAVNASKKLFSPIPEVDARIAAASEVLSAESRDMYAQRHVSIPTKSMEELAAMNAALAGAPVAVDPAKPEKRTLSGWLADHPRVAAAAVGVTVLAGGIGAVVASHRKGEKNDPVTIEAKPAFQKKAGPQGDPTLSDDAAFNEMMKKIKDRMQKMDPDKPEPRQ